MKRLIALAAIVVAGVFVIPAAAQAAPINECGSLPAGQSWWTYGPTDGAVHVANLTTRIIPCSYARPFAIRAMRGTRYGGRYWRVSGFDCRVLGHSWEYADYRCTGGNAAVIRWQTGA